MESWAAAKKALGYCVCATTAVRVPSQRLLPRASSQSRLSAKHKSDTDMVPGPVHRSPSILVLSGEKPRKILTGRPSDEDWATTHCLKWGLLAP